MNRTTKWVKLLVMLLLVATALTALTACGKGDDNGKTTTAATETGTKAPSSGEETTTGEGDELKPIDVKFNGEEIKFLIWIDYNVPEYFDNYEDVAGSVLELAIYNRRENTCDRLALDAVYVPMKRTDYMDSVRSGHMAGATYDGYISYSSDAATMAMEGMITNLSSLPYFNFTNPWYPDQLISECSLFGNLYFCSGDLSTNSLFMSTLVYFNKDIYKAHGLDAKVSSKYGYDNLYELVRNNAWTFDAMKTLAKNIYQDSDGNNMISGNDTFGFGTYYEELDSFYYSADFTTINSDDEGMHLSENFTNVNMVSYILDTVGKFLYQSGDAMFFGSPQDARAAFDQNRILFHMGPASHAYKVFKFNEGLTYGVVPVPMFEEGEARYKCTMSFGYCMYSIDSKTAKKDMCAAYIEELGRQSYLLTRPAIFEETFKLRYADNQDDSDMWDIVINAQSYDLGRVFNEQIGAGTNDQPLVLLFRKLLSTGASDWSSIMAGNRKLLTGYIDNINAKLREME